MESFALVGWNLFRGVGYTRPKLYRETEPEQLDRLFIELTQTHMSHTLRVVNNVAKWFENRRLVGDVYKEPDCLTEATIQCRVEGVIPEHVPAAAGLITDLYFGR